MKATIVVLKGNPDVVGQRIKLNMMDVLLRFVHKCNPKSELLQDDACFLLNLPKAEDGDVKWLMDNVLRKIYWDNTTNPREAEEKAERLYGIFKEAGGTDQAQLGVIRKYLQDMYLIEKCASIFTR